MPGPAGRHCPACSLNGCEQSNGAPGRGEDADGFRHKETAESSDPAALAMTGGQLLGGALLLGGCFIFVGVLVQTLRRRKSRHLTEH